MMQRKRALWILTCFLILTLALPTIAGAQGQPTIRTLNIALWPEYDDPRLLVILSGVIDAPQGTLRVPIPPNAELNAVAYANEEGRLLTAEWQRATDNPNVIIVTLPSPQFHVEYYLDAVQPGKQTVIQARVPMPEARILNAYLEVQQPANTADFQATPPLGDPQTGPDGLKYMGRTLGALSPGQVVEQEIRYTRLVPGLSVTPRTNAEMPKPTAPASPPKRNWAPLIAGVLITAAIGAVLILWMRRQNEPVRPPSRQRRLATTTLPRYCPNCGHPFAPNDRFCAMCGTKRPTHT